MGYSRRRLKVEHEIARTIFLLLGIIAAHSVGSWLANFDVWYSWLIAGAFVLLPTVWALGTLNVIFAFAEVGHNEAMGADQL